MKNLLEKIGIINFKYEKLREQNDFNIFSVLRSKTDEVNLHSRFIGELLDPDGSHKQGRVFLDLFLKVIGVEPTEVSEPKVYREYKNIDILVWSPSLAIVIENKIWAGDQEEQLDRYYNTLLAEGNKNVKLVYLTLKLFRV